MKKNIFRVLLAVGAIATVFAGCRKSELQQAQEPIKVTLRADRPGVQDETKTQLDGASVLWSVGDQIGVTNNAESNPTNYYFNNDAKDEPKSTTTFTGVNVSGNLFAYYPYSNEDINPKGAKVTIKTTQNPDSNTSFDGSCDVLVSKPFTVSQEGKQLSNLVFRRLTAVLKIVIKDNGIPSGEKISNITLESSATELTGKVNVSFDNFDLNGFTSSGQKSVSVNAKEPFAADGTTGLLACVYPGKFAAGSKLTISGTMSNYTFRKEITLTDKITFERGKITTLKVEIGNGHLTPLANYSGTYMITNVTTGDATKYAMKCYESGNNIKGLEYTINTQGKAVAEDIEDCKYVIEKVTDGEYKGMYTIKDVNEFYLYAAGDNSSNFLKSSSIPEDGDKKLYYWDINTSDDGATYNIVASKSGISRNVIMYNNSNKFFSCYSSGQKEVTLFPWSNVFVDTTPKIKVSATELGVDADGNPKGDAITVSGNRYTGDISASVTDGNTWLTGVSITDNKIEITATKNETAVTRNATIKLTATGAEPVEIAVTQDAAGTELPKQVTISYSDIPDGFTETTGTSGTFTKTVISTDDLTIAYAGINTKSKIDDADHSYKYAMFLKNNGFIYSNNAIDGYYVSKVTVTFSSGTGTSGKAGIIFGSTAASVSSRNSSVTGSVSKNGTCVASNTTSTNTFWNFSTNGANVQVSNIVVEYTKK